MNTLVSVIIPTYNRDGMILDAVNSVLEQTYQIFEVIIVDDGSTDNTKEVIRNAQDSRIKYIYQNNTGVSSARNNGIKNASGNYIAFLDSDDLWHPEKLEKQINLFDKNPYAGVCRCWTKYITFSGKEIKTLTHPLPSKTNLLKNFLIEPDNVFLGTLTLLIRKECFDNVGYFNTKMSHAEDWDMLFRLALYYDVINVDEILAYVRVNAESLSSNIDIYKLKDGYMAFLDNSFNNALLPDNVLAIENKAYSNIYRNIALQSLYKAKNYKISREYFIKSLKCSPDKIFQPRFLIAIILSFSPNFLMRTYEKLRSFYRERTERNYD